MNRKPMIGLAAVLAVCLVAAGAFAFGGWRGGHLDNETVAAIQAGDYAAYQQAVAANNVTGKLANLTQEQFNTLSQRFQDESARHAAMDAVRTAIADNDFAAWQSAMSNITTDQSQLTQERFNAIVQSQQIHAKVEQAIASNDFAAWKDAMTQQLQLQQSQLTQENFDRIVQMHEQMQNGTMQPRGFGRHHGPGGPFGAPDAIGAPLSQDAPVNG